MQKSNTKSVLPIIFMPIIYNADCIGFPAVFVYSFRSITVISQRLWNNWRAPFTV